MKNTPLSGRRREAQLSAVLADVPKADDHNGVREYLHALAQLGCAPLLIYPGSKQPADMRSPQRRSADDKAAQQEARNAGKRNWQRVKSDAGVHLATSDVATLDDYLDRYVETFGDAVQINVALSLGCSRLVVVDCDSVQQRAAFLADARADVRIAPTVSTPGHVGDGDANDPDSWAHSDGGHFWFVVPDDVELPQRPESMSIGDGDDAYSVMWGRGKYALIPPSVRDEGTYTVSGDVHALPDWLHSRIVAHGQSHAERAQRSREHIDNDSAVARWGATISWADILGRTEWTPNGKADSCGCETWAAPGPHASAKSATAHEPGCAQWVDSPDPPMHIWTDHDIEPFDALGCATVTRLQAVALIDFDNDMGAAMTALDLHDDSDSLALNDDRDRDVVRRDDLHAAADAQAQQTKGKRSLRITWAAAIEPEPVDWLWVDISARNTWSPETQPGTSPDPFLVDDIACVATGHEWSPPEVETDGRIPCGMVSIAAGREGSGKSSFGIWLTAKMTRGTLPGAHYGVPRRVFYLATEDSWKHTLVPRLMAADADLSMVARIEVVVSESSTVTLSLPEDIELLTESIVTNDVGLVVIDPLMSTLGQGLDANASRDVRTALEPISAMAERTGAAVVAIAHFNKATGLDALSRITGSGAFKDVARAVMVFARDGDERVFTQPKNSVGRDDLPSLNYAIRQAVVDTPKGKTATGRFVFTGCADRSVDEMLADERSRKRRKSPVTEFVVDYISEHADEQTGEVDAADVIAAGEAEGFSRKQIIDARARSSEPKISTRREGFGANGQSFWKIERS